MEKKLIKEINNFRKNIGLEKINETNESHVNANNLKSYLSGLGYKTQSNMDDYGDLTPTFAEMIKKVANNFKTYLPDIKFTFGSGNDNFHRKYGTSRHTKGNAMDITFSGGDSDKEKNLDDISIVLCNARQKMNGFTFIDEYRHPSSHSTGGHFHLSYSETPRDESRHTEPFCKSYVNNEELSDINFDDSETITTTPSTDKISKILDMFGLGVIANLDLDNDGKNFAQEVSNLFGGDSVEKDDSGEISIAGFKLKDLISLAKEYITEDIKKIKKKLL
jgi:hypothetical protein